MQPDIDAKEDPAKGTAGVKRPYQTPRVEESGSFERLVLSCAMRPGQNFQCNQMPSSA
jgi:hypothetical protein